MPPLNHTDLSGVKKKRKQIIQIWSTDFQVKYTKFRYNYITVPDALSLVKSVDSWGRDYTTAPSTIQKIVLLMMSFNLPLKSVKREDLENIIKSNWKLPPHNYLYIIIYIII